MNRAELFFYTVILFLTIVVTFETIMLIDKNRKYEALSIEYYEFQLDVQRASSEEVMEEVEETHANLRRDWVNWR